MCLNVKLHLDFGLEIWQLRLFFLAFLSLGQFHPIAKKETLEELTLFNKHSV